MIGWFISWFQRFVELGLKLAAELVAGILGAPRAAVRNAARDQRPQVRLGSPSEVLDLRHQTLRPGKPRETALFPGDEDASTRHWVAVDQGRVVGVVSVLKASPPEPLAGLSPVWQLRGMAVDEAYRGQDLGRELLLETHRAVAEPMWCNARQGVVGFYEKYGWTAVGEVFEVPQVGNHRKMVWRPTA